MKEKIVLNAWELVTKFHSLKKLNFIPSFFGMSWLFLILIYQSLFAYVYLFNKQDEVMKSAYNILHSSYIVEVAVVVGLVFILYMFLNPIAKGGIIHMIDTYRRNHGQKYHRSWQGFFDGLSHFLPLFEIQNITTIFAPLTILTSYIFLLRFFGADFSLAISIIMGAYLLFAFVMNMCFSYAPFFAIFEGKRGTTSLSASTGMAVRNIGITARLYFTNLLLYLRIVLIGGFFLLVPFIISSALAYFTVTTVQFFFLWIFLPILVVLFVFIVHLNSTLEIFIMALWYEAYQACKKEDEAFEAPHKKNKDESDHH